MLVVQEGLLFAAVVIHPFVKSYPATQCIKSTIIHMDGWISDDFTSFFLKKSIRSHQHDETVIMKCYAQRNPFTVVEIPPLSGFEPGARSAG